MDWQAASAIGTLVLAITTFVVIVLNYVQVQASRRQARASEDQTAAMREALEASQRPFLFPCNALVLDSDAQSVRFRFDQLDPGQSIRLKNVGSGIALNVWGVLVQPHPEVKTDLHLAPRMRSIVLDRPVSSGEEVELASRAGPFIFQWETFVGSDPKDTLVAPTSLVSEPQRQPLRVVARLTLTYEDLFGYTHASQFDYVEQGRWVFHRFLPKMPYGIEALARERDTYVAAEQSAFMNELTRNYRQRSEP